ncbi:hypothetical protein R1flu_010081 [Riccia fluitans]|uniref:EamA domain-containing protein n=1 Tax=Riccia fluitans TaxID=41844 RepID=A0ABD1Z400_9MARC
MERSELPFSISLRWVTGVIYIVLVALIWVTASFVVQSVVDGGVSPFLITYICNSLFVVYIPIVEGGNKLKSMLKQKGWCQILNVRVHEVCEEEAPRHFERQNLLEYGGEEVAMGRTVESEVSLAKSDLGAGAESREVRILETEEQTLLTDVTEKATAVDGSEVEPLKKQNQPWSRKRTALVGLWICPLWFLAQLTYNFSLKYTTVTSNTILSTTSSLFTLMVSIIFLGERFTCWKLVSVLLSMSGTIVVALGDSQNDTTEVAPKPVWGDILTLTSAIFYALYTALIRAKIPDEDERNCSTALVLGYLGLFNALFFGPVALILHFSGVEPFHRLTITQVGLIVGKGLLDNVLSDYLWAKAVLFTSPTVATTGLTIQVPIAAVVDSFRGIVPAPANVLGAIIGLIGFFGINRSPVTEEDDENGRVVHEGTTTPATSSV